jgi:hypothetical protein
MRVEKTPNLLIDFRLSIRSTSPKGREPIPQAGAPAMPEDRWVSPELMPKVNSISGIYG